MLIKSGTTNQSVLGVRTDSRTYVSAVAPGILESGDNTALPARRENARPLGLYGSDIWYDSRFGPHKFFVDQKEVMSVAEDHVRVAGHGVIAKSRGPGSWNHLTGADDVVIFNDRENLGYNASAPPRAGNGITLAPWNGHGALRVDGLGVQLRGRSVVDGTLENKSDARLKRDIGDIPAEEVDRVTELRPRQYRLKTDAAGAAPQYGFVAQEVERLYPNLVSSSSSLGKGEKEEEDGIRSMSYLGIIPLLVGKLRRLAAQVRDDRICIGDVCITKEDIAKLRRL